MKIIVLIVVKGLLKLKFKKMKNILYICIMKIQNLYSISLSLSYLKNT
jgi:hypothetical protein